MSFATAIELVILVLAVGAIVFALRHALRMRLRQQEYERALRDYRSLARHRLANPLTVIRGGLETLRSQKLSRRQRDELIEAIAIEAARLESVALDPRANGDEERELRPEPGQRDALP
jgi:signal transduction histidine kinase